MLLYLLINNIFHFLVGSTSSGANTLSLSVLASGASSSTPATSGTTNGTSHSSRPAASTAAGISRAVTSGGTTPATPGTTRIVGFTANTADTPRNTRDRECEHCHALTDKLSDFFWKTYC